MNLGNLTWAELTGQQALVASVVYDVLNEATLKQVFATKTNPELADTENFCNEYGVKLEESANCVIVKAKRADKVWYAALMILATDRADVNKIIKKHLGARKLSFAPMEEAVDLTKMEYGGITPIGLPEDWPILIDENVANKEKLVIGSGHRGSKLAVSGEFLASLPGAEVLAMTVKK